jgi:hypothetical protein
VIQKRHAGSNLLDRPDDLHARHQNAEQIIGSADNRKALVDFLKTATAKN